MDEYAITIENYNRKRSKIRRNLRREMKRFKDNFDIIIKQLKEKNACYIYYNHYDDDKERIESSMRNVRRYKKKCLQLILNVANGEFPGKY